MAANWHPFIPETMVWQFESLGSSVRRALFSLLISALMAVPLRPRSQEPCEDMPLGFWLSNDLHCAVHPGAGVLPLW